MIAVSVVMPYWKRGRALRELLENYLLHYADKEDMEVVIVDDGSPSDPALPVVEEFRDRFACDLRVIQMPIKEEGKDNCVVYNRGVEEARGEYVFLTQTDIVHVSPVVSIEQSVMDDAAKNGAGEVCILPGSFCQGRETFRANQFLPSVAPDGVMIRKDVYQRLGGFHEEYRDGYAVSDVDFALTVTKAKVRRIALCDVIVYHRFEKGETWQHDDDRWRRNIQILKGRHPGIHEFEMFPLLVTGGSLNLRLKS